MQISVRFYWTLQALEFLRLPMGSYLPPTILDQNPNNVAAALSRCNVGHSHTAEIFHSQNAESETAADDNEWGEAKRETNRN